MSFTKFDIPHHGDAVANVAADHLRERGRPPPPPGWALWLNARLPTRCWLRRRPHGLRDICTCSGIVIFLSRHRRIVAGPLSNLLLQSCATVPNIALRSAISEWAETIQGWRARQQARQPLRRSGSPLGLLASNSCLLRQKLPPTNCASRSCIIR